jgi:hypothetical protein
MLNVVEPSPVPYAVPMTPNRAAYVVRDRARPSHMSHDPPAGSPDPAYGTTTPIGRTLVAIQPASTPASAAGAASKLTL